MAASSTILSFIISVTTAGAQNITSLGNNISRLQGIYMGLAGVVGGVVVQAIRRAALEFDQAEKQADIFYLTLGRFGQNIGEADAAVDRLSKRFNVNKSTVQDSVTQLLRVGYTMEQIEKNLTGAGASALAFGKSAQMGFNNFTEAAVTGLSVQLNSIGISQNLAQAYDKMAKSLGKSTDELTDQEKALATTEMITKATSMEVETLSTLTSGLSATNDKATLAQQNLSKVIGELFLPYVIKSVQWTANIVNMTAEWIKTNTWLAPTIEALANILMGLVNLLMGAVRTALNVIINYFATLGQVIGRVIGGFQNAASQLGQVWENIKSGNFKGAKEAGQEAEKAFKNSFSGIGSDLQNVWKDTLKPLGQSADGLKQIAKGGQQITDVYNGKLKPAVKDVAAEKQNLWERGKKLGEQNKGLTDDANQNAEALKRQKQAAQEWARALEKEKLDQYKESLKGMTKSQLEAELALQKSAKNADKYLAVLDALKDKNAELAEKAKQFASAQERLKFDAYVEGLKNYTDAQLKLALANAKSTLDVEKFNAVITEQKRRLDELKSVVEEIALTNRQSALTSLVGDMSEEEVEGTLKMVEGAIQKATNRAELEWLKFKKSVLEARLDALKTASDAVGEALESAANSTDMSMRKITNAVDPVTVAFEDLVDRVLPALIAGVDGVAEGLSQLVDQKIISPEDRDLLLALADPTNTPSQLDSQQGRGNNSTSPTNPMDLLKLPEGMKPEEMVRVLLARGYDYIQSVKEELERQAPDALQSEFGQAVMEAFRRALGGGDGKGLSYDNPYSAGQVGATFADRTAYQNLVPVTFEDLVDQYTRGLIEDREATIEILQRLVDAGRAVQEDVDYLLALTGNADVPSLLDSQEGKGNFSSGQNNPMDLLKLPEGASPEELVQQMLAQGYDYIQQIKERLERIAPGALQSEFGKVVMEAFRRALGGGEGKQKSYDNAFSAGLTGPTFADRTGLAALTESFKASGDLQEVYGQLDALAEEIQLFQGNMTPEIIAGYVDQLTQLKNVVGEMGGDSSPWTYLTEVLENNKKTALESQDATDALTEAQNRLTRALGKEGAFDSEIASLEALKRKYPELTEQVNRMIQAYQNLASAQQESAQLEIDYALGSITRDDYLNRLKAALDAELKSNGNTQKAVQLKRQIAGIEKEITDEKEQQDQLNKKALEDAQKLSEERLKAITGEINNWGNALLGVLDILNGGAETFGQKVSALSGVGNLIGTAIGGPAMGQAVEQAINMAGQLIDAVSGEGAKKEAARREQEWLRRKEQSGLLRLDDFTSKSTRSVGLFGLGGTVTDYNVDEQAVKFAQPIADAVENGWDTGLMQALENADFSLLEKSIKKSVAQGIIGAMAEQFKAEVLQAILSPALKAWAEARKTADKGDDAAALQGLRDAMNQATDATKAFYDEVLPLAEEAGLTGDGSSAGGAGGDRNLFGAAPEAVFAPVSTPIVQALDRLSQMLLSLKFPNIDGLIASVDRFDAATTRFDGSTQLFDAVVKRLETRLGGSSTAITTGYARP